MGLTVTTDDRGVKVFRHENTTENGGVYATYSVSVSSKDKDENWHSAFLPCVFKKGVSVEDRTVIRINNAFYTVNFYNGKTYPKIMITDFEVISSEASSTDPSGFMSIPDSLEEELPFN